ncbi:hypothetical protein Trydic_g3463 [Trypoxylus dichotomus]
MSKEPKKPLTAQEQLEMDIMAVGELARLQRQYRIMDGDRRAFEKDTVSHLTKQGRVLRVLRKENADLQENLHVAEKLGKKKDLAQILKIQSLLQENSKYKEAIKQKKNDLREIEHQIRKVADDALKYGNSEKKINGEIQKRIEAGQKAIESQENKLDTCVKRFCVILAENQQLRQEIEHLLIERNIYNTVYDSLLKALVNGKKFMIDLIEQATLSYDQREECGEKLQALRIRARNDYLIHVTDMRELIRELDRGITLRDFLTVKGQKRLMRDLEKKEQQKRQRAREAIELELTRYKTALVKVQEIAGEQDIPKLTAQFIKQEEENFALFNYVNELHCELETLGENINKYQTNIEDQKEINARRAEQQKDTIDSLKAELQKVKEEEQTKKKILDEKDEELSKLLKGIQLLSNIARVDNTPLLNLLGNSTTINNYNVLIHLGMLESKVNDMVRIANYKDKLLVSVDCHKILGSFECSKTLYDSIEDILPVSPCAICAEELLSDVNITSLQSVKTTSDIQKDMFTHKDPRQIMHKSEKCKLLQSLL